MSCLRFQGDRKNAGDGENIQLYMSWLWRNYYGDRTRVLYILQDWQVSMSAEAKAQSAKDLYNYIYWQAWNALTPLSQGVMLSMPLCIGGNIDQIAVLSELEIEETQTALEELMKFSLVQSYGSFALPRYAIHRLTQAFMFQEVIRWMEVVE